MENAKLSNEKIMKLSNASEFHFPKYTSQIINWANQNAQGTRPKVVGQMSDIIQEFNGQSISEWISWYNDKMPNAINDATDKIYDMVDNIRKAAEQIDKKMVREWVMDLIYTKTYCGLKVQQIVISYIADIMNKSWRLATKEEESKNIDGYIGECPIQIKSSSYKVENHLGQNIEIPIVYYEKKKDSLYIEYDITEIEKYIK
jgi:hypothetical protein